MIRKIKTVEFLLLTLTIFCLSNYVQAQENSPAFQGKVLSAESGSSLVLEIDKRKVVVTFPGVSAVGSEQPTGKESQRSLSRLLKGRQVTFFPAKEFDPETDQSSEGKILYENQDAALQQLGDGLAYITKEGRTVLADEDRKSYEKAEHNAFEKQLGLWSSRYKCENETAIDKTAGMAEIELLIDESGNVVRAKALCENPIFRSAAVELALLAKFKPTILKGFPVKVAGKITYIFEP